MKSNPVNELPPHLTMEDEMEYGKVYAPVRLEGLPDGPRSKAKILEALETGDRAPVKKAMKKGFKPVLLVDLESGASAMEMRRHTPPGLPPRRESPSKISFPESVLYSEVIKLSDDEAKRIAIEICRVGDISQKNLVKALSPVNARKLNAVLKVFGSDRMFYFSAKNDLGEQYLTVRRQSREMNVLLPLKPLLRVEHLAGRLGLPSQIMIEKIVEYYANSEKSLENTVLKKWVEEGGDARQLRNGSVLAGKNGRHP